MYHWNNYNFLGYDTWISVVKSDNCKDEKKWKHRRQIKGISYVDSEITWSNNKHLYKTTIAMIPFRIKVVFMKTMNLPNGAKTLQDHIHPAVET